MFFLKIRLSNLTIKKPKLRTIIQILLLSILKITKTTNNSKLSVRSLQLSETETKETRNSISTLLMPHLKMIKNPNLFCSIKNKLFKNKKLTTLHLKHKSRKFRSFRSQRKKAKRLLDLVSTLKKSTKCTLTEEKEANKSSFLRSKKRLKSKKSKG